MVLQQAFPYRYPPCKVENLTYKIRLSQKLMGWFGIHGIVQNQTTALHELEELTQMNLQVKL